MLESDSNTILFMHEFFKKWLIALIRIINECEIKKVLEHLYSFEYSKYYKYKKIKTKNKIYNSGNNDNESISAANGANDFNLKNKTNLLNDIDDVVGLDNLVDSDQASIKSSNINKTSKNNIQNSNKEEAFDDFLDFENSKDSECNDDVSNNEKKTQKYDQFENLFEDKNDSYYENLMFQDMRTKTMNENEYFFYINCRTSSFLTKNKKILVYILSKLIFPLIILNLRIDIQLMNIKF